MSEIAEAILSERLQREFDKLPAKEEQELPAFCIAVANLKGGTGKTATAAAIAQAAAHNGRRVVAIDLDPQGQLSFALAADTGKPGSYELLNGADAADVIQHTRQGLDIIPASWNLSTIQSGRGSARRLQRALEQVRYDHELIVIDSPPTP